MTTTTNNNITQDVTNKPDNAKEMQMTCSHCQKAMMKGQTAYQKKGFTDVFCSKNCLFALFPVNKPNTKICHFCHKAISQPLDLIMAAVDVKGTMKDFCSVTCLVSFKSNTPPAQTPPSICMMCNKSCTTTSELTLNGSLHKFCSDSCMDDFSRHNMAMCENCNSIGRNKPLILMLKEETKTICSDDCLEEFKESIETSYQCTMCDISLPMSDMVHNKSDEDMVELFCTRTCVRSYMLRPDIVDKLQEKKNAALLRRKRGKQSEQTWNTEDGSVTSNSVANDTAAKSETPTFTFAKECVVCCHCGKELQSGETLVKLKKSREVFCSASCLSEKHPHVKLDTKKCYNCFQVILRPHNIILAPVDDSGTMKELCSNACLSSVNSKRNLAAPKPPPPPECRMCTKFCSCKFKLNPDGSMQRLPQSACSINDNKVNDLPGFTCDVCGSVCSDSRLTLKMDGGSKTSCSEECLVKLKQKIETPQLCPMCQTSHQISDMVDSRNDEGWLDFFCSNRCMMVHKAQSSTVSGRNSPSFDKNDIKEVKPSLLNLDCIKQEPIDEEYKQSVSPSISTEDIKDEPNVIKKEDLKIGSVFSLTGVSTSTAPTLTHRDLPASCSNCKKVLMDGETVYQRKAHSNIFCSTPCLLKFYQTKQAKKTCHFCLQAITQPKDVLQAPVDNEETMKDFCSQTCLSSFNYKTIMSTRISIVPVASQSQCSMCSRYCVIKHEILQQDVVHKICSDPCFFRFCNMNNLSVCENCRSNCNTPVMLKMENGSIKLCSAECLVQFKQKIEAPQPCAMCSTPHLMSDMVENKNSEDVVELFCTNSCVMAAKIQAVSASGIPLNCDNCGKTTLPACHLAMSDASIRNFCTLTCAMAFKETQNAATSPTAASDQTQCDFLKPPEKLPCAQCRRILKTTPKVVQKKGKMNFVCSQACSQEFKRVNNTMGKCEFCKNERIIKDVKRVNDKDCYFCSDGCIMLFCHELEERWGEYCHLCAYCLSTSKTLVTAQYKGVEEEFCSEECNSNYNMLFCHLAKCDTCGREGKLRQSLPMLGEVKHFCDLKCLLHFCNKKVQMVNKATVSSPPKSAGTVESSPVIANVISLAGTLAKQPDASASSAQHVSLCDIQTKVVGHASVQTVPKELKNKSMLCTPLVHNKGISCTTQTVNTETQTDNFEPKVVVLPLPVPVYLPVPMGMYSQYTPKPVGLPLPLPVPVFLPATPDGPDQTVEPVKERIQPVSFGEEFDFKSEIKETQDENDETKEEIHTPKEHSSDSFDVDHQATINNLEDFLSDTIFGSPSRTHTHGKDVGMTSELQLPLEMREDPESSLSPAQVPPLLQQTVGKVHNKNKGRKLQRVSKAADEETSQRDFSKSTSRKQHKLKSQCGIDAWKRWIQLRESQTDLDLVSSRTATFSEDVLRCSATELSDGLCRFITEVKGPDGAPYSPDYLFYLCLSIQQYLFDNDRMENIFSDRIYSRFSTRFTKILKAFKPSVTASGRIQSSVEEEFLWDCKQLGAYSPIVLLNTLLFFCCKFFGFTTVEQHRQLSFAHVTQCTKTNPDGTETAFLRFYRPISRNDAESDADGVPAKKCKKHESKEDILEMMENTENPLRCPVRLYEFYLSKCSESVTQRTDLFYLQPDRSCVPNSPLWFSSTPLDSGTMEAMLVRTLAVGELQWEYRRGVDQQTADDSTFIPDEEDSQ
ncbi:zinc finger MYM-type protein 4-like isoform X1 [Dicentrarchus labrax]|uniref:zinc finger MYM-type protein 4-like isoform X1 n=1 Tax=Dicentrarchus labrax TaxID=13489 RepID=UPI0021F548BA|nr:zinc finger MYM-type protein 4-like isoform X1 [Dicentrarchus labrax]XP_051245716.1 zinc finger MYM-type protein 4-like isoform X1 [Dicentrarchus labrax]